MINLKRGVWHTYDSAEPIDAQYAVVFVPGRGWDMAMWNAEAEIWEWRSQGYAIRSEVTHFMYPLLLEGMFDEPPIVTEEG